MLPQRQLRTQRRRSPGAARLTNATIYSRFIITDFAYSCTALGIAFTCTTDVPCKLKMYYSDNKPIFKVWKHKKRGIVQRHDRFPAWNYSGSIWQEEPDDTYIHTFHLTNIVWDHIYYFHLANKLPYGKLYSVSQMFHHQCPKPAIVPACYSEGSQTTYFSYYNQYRHAYGFKPLRTYTATQLEVWLSRSQGSGSPTAINFYIFNAQSNGKPIDPHLFTYSCPAHLTDWPNSSQHICSIPPFEFVEGQNYAMSVAMVPFYPLTYSYMWRIRCLQTQTCQLSTAHYMGYAPSSTKWSSWYGAGSAGPWHYAIPETT